MAKIRIKKKRKIKKKKKQRRILMKKKKNFKNIATLIKKHRKEKGVSQNWLARKLGFMCSGQFLSNIEREICTIPTYKIECLSVSLKIPMSDIEDAMVADFKFNLGFNNMTGHVVDENLSSMVILS